MNGPRRTQIQRQSRGPVIGAPPVGYVAGTGKAGQTYGPKGPSGRSADYDANLAAKQARDRAATLEREQQRAAEGRGRKAALTQSRNGAQVGGGGAAGGANGANGANGRGAAVAPFTAAGAWWENPWLWGAAIAIYLYTRRGKK